MSSQVRTPAQAAIPAITLGWRLQIALGHSGIGVQEMADTLGVGRNTASRWMHDHGVPRRAYIAQWALKTGVDLAWLEHGTMPATEDAPADDDPSQRKKWAPWDSNPQPTDWVPGVVLTGPWGGAA